MVPNTYVQKVSFESTNRARSFQGSDLWKDKDRFIKFAQASLELCRVYMHISATTNSQRELYAAEMHLKNTVKQARLFSLLRYITFFIDVCRKDLT